MITYNGKTFRCPVEVTMDIISGKWKCLILWHLHDGPMRYTELIKIVPGVSQKMLTQQLKEMENDNLLIRTVYPVVPPKVEYELTALGHSVFPMLEMMHGWAISNLPISE